MRALPILTLALLAGCAHDVRDPPADKPTAVSCVPAATPAAPRVHAPEQIRLAPADAAFVVMTASDYQALYGWMQQAAPVLETCRKAAAPP